MKDTQRTELFRQTRERLEGEGYVGKECTISVLRANIMAFVTAGPVAVLCIVIFCLEKGEISLYFDLWEFFVMLGVFIASLFIHEGLHGLTWSRFSENGWRDIHIGVMWDKLTPYCCCMKPLTFGKYLLGGLMPFLVLGLGLFLAALLTKNEMLLLCSVYNILSAGGDTTIACILLKHRHAVIIDHPTECGFWAFEKE